MDGVQGIFLLHKGVQFLFDWVVQLGVEMVEDGGVGLVPALELGGVLHVLGEDVFVHDVGE